MSRLNFDARQFCKDLPKIELHAHLNGSISKETLMAIMKKKGKTTSVAWESTNTDMLKLENCFALFGEVYKLIDDPETLAFATKAVIQDFERVGTRYLELRSTPRETPSMTREQYVNAVMDVLAEYQSSSSSIIVRMILSVDRRHPLESNMATIDLAIQNRSKGVVAVDVCGDPTQGNWSNVKQPVMKAKSAGLKVTCHLGEIEGTDDESQLMLLAGIDRIGHGTFMNDRVRAQVIKNKIPIEICMTSNVLGQTVASYKDHHVAGLIQEKHPISICTDDKGLFNSDLVNEWYLLMTEHELSPRDIYNLSLKSLGTIFEKDEEVTFKLDYVWKEFEKKHATLFGANKKA